MKIRQIKYIIGFILLALTSCIESFTPQIKPSNVDQYVVSGFLNNKEGFHQITISKTSSISDPKFIPISGCRVTINDEDSNDFTCKETEPGKYKVWIDQIYLEPGKAYKLSVETANGELLETNYIEMPYCGRVDSIYSIKELPEIVNPYFDNTEGLQFYLDFSGNETDSKYNRWELTETWQYKSTEKLILIIDRTGWTYVDEKINDTVKTCWKTEKIDGYYIKNTEHLSENKYNKLKLHYVDNHSQRLMYGYYLKVDQYAINKEAYYYWKQIEENNTQTGGLYEKQPIPVYGNIKNLTNPDKKTLGYFEVSSTNTKTYFIKDIIIRMALDRQCFIQEPSPFSGLPLFSRSPMYINDDYNIIEKRCWNCAAGSGTNKKPDFWPVR